MEELRIVPTAELYVEGLNAVVGLVARERRYIGLVEAPPVESTRSLVQRILDGAGVQMLALTPQDTVVGWCDIMRNPLDGFRHCGRLGMGFLPLYRGRGWGRQLVARTIAAARDVGIERVELEVFATNKRAIAFYEAAGFVIEGVKRKARNLDGQYDDNVFMALLCESG